MTWKSKIMPDDAPELAGSLVGSMLRGEGQEQAEALDEATTPPDFRALCAELLARYEEQLGREGLSCGLITRARAALEAVPATPAPVPVAEDCNADNLRTALCRLIQWGGMAGGRYSATITIDVLDWFKKGSVGPLPELPDWALGR